MLINNDLGLNVIFRPIVTRTPFSKVSKSDFEQLQQQQKQSQEAQQVSEASEKRVLSAKNYYFAQIKKYRAKNPNTKDFPAYEVAK